MTKKTYSIIAVVVILVIAGFFWWRSTQQVQAPETVAPVDTTEAIQDDLAGIDIGDVDAEFKDVDEVMNNL